MAFRLTVFHRAGDELPRHLAQVEREADSLVLRQPGQVLSPDRHRNGLQHMDRRLRDALEHEQLLHRLVRLFQRLAGWADPPISRPDAIFHIFGWLMPSRERMHKEVQSGKPDGSKASGPRLGAAPVYEPMPPRTCVSFEATGKVLRLLADRQLLEKELVPYLLRAAEALVERKGARRVVDVVRESKA